MPHFSTVQGVRVYYETEGNVTGPDVVFLHGLGSAIPLWQSQRVFLRQHYRLWFLDFPGHGRSDRQGGYTLAGLVDVLAEWLTAMGLRQPHLVGLSLGCAVALTYASRVPSGVASLVLQAPVGGFRPAWDPRSWQDRVLLGGYLLFLGVLWQVLDKHRAVEFVNHYGFQTFGYYPELVAIQMKVDPRAVWQLGMGVICPPYVGKLSKVDCPVLLISGQHDITPRCYYDYICAEVAGPCDAMVVPRARHVVSVEQPEVFNHRIAAFLTDIEKQPCHYPHAG